MGLLLDIENTTENETNLPEIKMVDLRLLPLWGYL